MSNEFPRPETLRDVADTNPSPQPNLETPPDTPNRLCSADEECGPGDAGCRRSHTILALEAEYDTFVRPDMYWGFWDQFCQHEGSIYFYKKMLTDNIEADINNVEDDETKAKIQQINSFLGYSLDKDTSLSIDKIRGFFTSGVTGLPALELETPQFFKCADIGTDNVNVDTIDKATLELVKNTFTSDTHPLLANTADSLYIKDGKVFCTDLLSYENNPAGKLGLLMIPSKTDKYQVGKPYFFPFSPLTPEQAQFIQLVADVESENAGPVTIIDL